jgi:hypothetical protein
VQEYRITLTEFLKAQPENIIEQIPVCGFLPLPGRQLHQKIYVPVSNQEYS